MRRKSISLILICLLFKFSSCKMWPVSVGIYNQSAGMLEVNLTVSKNDKNAIEVFPLVLGRFDDSYDQISFRNISPLKIDTTALEFQTVYHLMPGESLKIATYWDTEYRGYQYYETSGKEKKGQKSQIQKISITNSQLNISSSPNRLDSLVKPLNKGKKIWGIVVF